MPPVKKAKKTKKQIEEEKSMSFSNLHKYTILIIFNVANLLKIEKLEEEKRIQEELDRKREEEEFKRKTIEEQKRLIEEEKRREEEEKRLFEERVSS